MFVYRGDSKSWRGNLVRAHQHPPAKENSPWYPRKHCTVRTCYPHAVEGPRYSRCRPRSPGVRAAAGARWGPHPRLTPDRKPERRVHQTTVHRHLQPSWTRVQSKSNAENALKSIHHVHAFPVPRFVQAESPPLVRRGTRDPTVRVHERAVDRVQRALKPLSSHCRATLTRKLYTHTGLSLDSR